MCFYDQYEYACKDFRWGNFREHCTKEYRRGETCGMKLVHHVIPKGEMCTLCDKIQTKTRRWYKYEEKLKQWEREGRLAELSATVEKYRSDQADVRREIDKLNEERAERARAIGRMSKGSGYSASNGHSHHHGSGAYAGASGYNGGYSNGYPVMQYGQGNYYG